MTSSTKNGLPSVSPCSADTRSEEGGLAPWASISSPTSAGSSPSSATCVRPSSRRSEAISSGSGCPSKSSASRYGVMIVLMVGAAIFLIVIAANGLMLPPSSP